MPAVKLAPPPPSPAQARLAPLVRRFQAVENPSSEFPMLALPFPTVVMVLRGRARVEIKGSVMVIEAPAAILIGPLTVMGVAYPHPDTRVVSATLHAGALSSFVRCDAGKLTNRLMDLRELWSEETVGRLLAGIDPDMSLDTAMSRFVDWLAELVVHPEPPFSIPFDSWDLPVGEQAAQAGLSVRHHQRQLARHYGVSASQLRRYARYLQAMEAILLSLDDASVLSHLAVQAGYFDQAHMWRDFQILTGWSPQALREVLKLNRTTHTGCWVRATRNLIVTGALPPEGCTDEK